MALMLPVMYPADVTNAKKGHISLIGAGLSLAPSLDVNGKPVLILTPTMSSATPSAPGSATAGAATTPARGDHVHAPPTAAQVGSPPVARSMASGQGLSGGGDLSADRTLVISSFTGILAKDWDPGSTMYPRGAITTLKTYTVGPQGHIMITGLRLPARGNAALRTRLRIEFNNGSSLVIVNNGDSPMNSTEQFISDSIMGNASSDQSATNDGLRIVALSFQVENTDPSNDITVDLNTFRVRAYVVPAGGGTVVVS